MKKDKPILFSTPMVQAILTGRKTQTRRIIKPQPSISKGVGKWIKNDKIQNIGGAMVVMDYMVKNAPYKVGQTLWVRETWQHGDRPDCPIYKAGGDGWENFVKANPDLKWKPSIFMPKDVCRIFLKVIDVRVELLQDISQQDAKDEGVDHVIDKITGYCGYNYKHGGYNLMTTPYHGFRSLWETINGEESWKENPYVWVIEFTL